MTLTRSEMFHGNLELTSEQLLDVLANPERYDWIPDGAHVIGLPLNNPRLFEANMQLAQQLALKGDGQPIILIPERVQRKRERRKARAKAI